MVSIVSEIFFSGVSGSTAADTAAIGSIMIPAMNEAGYPPARATAMRLCCLRYGDSGASVHTMVVYGGVANTSIGALFAGGFLPALLMASALMIQLNIQARRAGIAPRPWEGMKPLSNLSKNRSLLF